MRVLVLGCGPAGLIAAHAAVVAGAEVGILSKPRKSHMNGAQYLHRPIPGVDCGEPFQVEYVLKGTPASYRMKVYGRQWDGTVSPEDLAESHTAWNIRSAYDDLWDKYGHAVVNWEATPATLRAAIERNKPDILVSSVPAPLLCSEGHTFQSQRVWSTDRLMVPMEDNTVICNGEEVPRWYRAAKIQGWETVEWPDGAKPPITPMWEVQKPKTHNCTCFPDLLRVGRYGRWQKGVLSHEAWEDVVRRIQEVR